MLLYCYDKKGEQVISIFDNKNIIQATDTKSIDGEYTAHFTIKATSISSDRADFQRLNTIFECGYFAYVDVEDYQEITTDKGKLKGNNILRYKTTKISKDIDGNFNIYGTHQFFYDMDVAEPVRKFLTNPHFQENPTLSDTSLKTLLRLTVKPSNWTDIYMQNKIGGGNCGDDLTKIVDFEYISKLEAFYEIMGGSYWVNPIILSEKEKTSMNDNNFIKIMQVYQPYLLTSDELIFETGLNCGAFEVDNDITNSYSCYLPIGAETMDGNILTLKGWTGTYRGVEKSNIQDDMVYHDTLIAKIGKRHKILDFQNVRIEYPKKENNQEDLTEQQKKQAEDDARVKLFIKTVDYMLDIERFTDNNFKIDIPFIRYGKIRLHQLATAKDKNKGIKVWGAISKITRDLLNIENKQIELEVWQIKK